MRAIKQWGGFCVFGVLSLTALGLFLWNTSRPVVLDPAELTLAEGYESYPEVELLLDITNYQMSMTLENHSDIHIETGAAVDRNRNLIEIPGLDVLLDGSWYKVPHEDYATAGVSLGLAPGNRAEMQVRLSPYGKLPDGAYRLSVSCWYYDPEWERAATENPDYAEYSLYARFDIAGGKYSPV